VLGGNFCGEKEVFRVEKGKCKSQKGGKALSNLFGKKGKKNGLKKEKNPFPTGAGSEKESQLGGLTRGQGDGGTICYRTKRLPVFNNAV